jgi:hypothetical protein
MFALVLGLVLYVISARDIHDKANLYDFIKIEKWQTVYLYVYAIWMAVVAFLFPIIFGFC